MLSPNPKIHNISLMPVLHTVLVVIIVYKYISVFIKCQVKEPQVRIELTTARLQIACSTAELLWHIKSGSGRIRTHMSFRTTDFKSVAIAVLPHFQKKNKSIPCQTVTCSSCHHNKCATPRMGILLT